MRPRRPPEQSCRLAGDDAVLPRTLCRVRRRIGTLNSILERLVGSRDNDTGTESHGTTRPRNRLRRELAQESRNGFRRGLERSLGEHQNELLAAKTAENVARTHRPLQNRHQLTECPVTHLTTQFGAPVPDSVFDPDRIYE